MKDLHSALSATTYPGRGIVIGMHENGSQAVVLYFIMGRSENSRNRIFAQDGTGIRTEAFDPASLVDPSLIIYSPVKNIGANLIVTNGDQTDTIFKELVKRHASKQDQLSFHQSVHIFDKAMRRREYEPDAPSFTPRISGIVHIDKGRMQYAMNIVKADISAREMKTPPCLRATFTYETAVPGHAHFIHTYQGPGEVLPSFTGEPEPVLITGDIDRVADTAWDALDADNRVSLFVRFIDLKGRKPQDRIINKNR